MSNETQNNATEKTKSARNIRVILPLTIIAVLVVLTVAHQAKYGCDENYRRDVLLSTPNQLEISAQIASDPADQAKGLGGRSCIGEGDAMLFSFSSSGFYPFWMKDMKFPIDMVWINADHQVVTVDTMVLPSSYPRTYTSSKKAQYVLELKAGEASMLGLTEGTTLNF